MHHPHINDLVLTDSNREVNNPEQNSVFSVLHEAWLRYSILAFFFTLYFLPFQNALIDDAFIYLDYVKSIVIARKWGITSVQVTNTATSPLNVILMALLARIMGISTKIPIWLAAICSLVSIYYLEKISMRLFNTRFFGTTGALLLMVNPLLLSTLGMECFLFAALTIVALSYFLERRWNVLAFVLGLLSLARPDGVVYALVFSVFLPSMKVRFKYLAVFLLTILPWLFFPGCTWDRSSRTLFLSRPYNILGKAGTFLME